MPGSVERWLQSFMCTQYAHVIESYGYKTLQAVCHLQLPHLLAMGVPRNHSEMIIENVHILRQTMFGGYPNSQESDFQSYRYNTPLNPAVSVLKTAAMNANYRGMAQYPEDYSGYNQSGNSMHPMGYHQGRYNTSNMGMMNPASAGYGVQGYEATHHGHMMMGGQGQVAQHTAMFQQQQAYMAQQQFYTSSAGGGAGGGQFAGQQYSMQGTSGMQGMINSSSGYYASASAPGSGGGTSTGQSPSTSGMVPPHHHLRNTSGQQNPQQVADNILQMASSYPSHHTVGTALQVQVPLKNRHTPYQIPRSSHFNYSQDKSVGQGQGVSVQQSLGGQQGLAGQSMSQQTIAGQTLGAQQALPAQSMGTQQMIGSGQHTMTGQSLNSQQTVAAQQAVGRSQSGNNLQQHVAGVGGQGGMLYPQSSPHSHLAPQASPMSPLMNSPASVQGQQGQGLASPNSLHSPGSTSALRSPAPSPSMCGMRSPCSLSVGGPGAMRSPVQLPTGFATQQMSSPPHRTHSSSDTPICSQQPHSASTVVHSPVSHVSSPYTPGGPVTHISSPPQPPSYITPNPSPYRLSDSSQGPGHGPGGTGQGQGSSPLQFLQKLVMLPETQVVDPKSVVSEACIGGSSSDSSKNCEGPAEQCSEDVGCSVGNSSTTSPLVNHTSPDSSGDAEICEKPSSSAGKNCLTHSEKHEPVSSVLLAQTGDTATSMLDGNQTSAVTSSSLRTKCTGSFSPSQTVSSNSQASSHSSTSPSAATPSSSNCDISYTTSPSVNFASLSTLGSIGRQTHGFGGTKTATSASPHKIHSTPVKCNGIAKQVDAIIDGDNTNSILSKSNQPSAATKGLIKSTKQETYSSSVSKPRSVCSSKTSKQLVMDEVVSFSEEHGQVTRSLTTDCALKIDVNKANPVVNGFEERQMNGNVCDVHDPQHNHVCTRNRSKQKCTGKDMVGNEISDTLEIKNRKVVLSKCRSKHIARDVVTVTSHHLVAAVSTPTQGAVRAQASCLPSHLSDSEGEREEMSDAEVACAFSRISSGALKRAGSVEDFGPFNDSGSDDEDFSFSDGLDFGYDSPPCEMTGEDSWQLDPTKRVAGTVQPEGEARCADQGSEKGRSSQTGKSSTGNLNKTSTISTSYSRTVTRSATGRAPKRTFEDPTSSSKRVKRTSGPGFSHSNGELCLKSDKSLVDKDGTKSPIKEKTDEKKDSSPKRNCRKSPVVVLTKTPDKITKKNKGKKVTSSTRGSQNDKMRKMDTKCDVGHADNHASHLPRGPDGRFVRKTTDIKSPSGTFSVSEAKDFESDDEPLIVVQRRASKGDSDAILVPSGKAASDKLKSDQEKELKVESSKGGVSCAQSEVFMKASGLEVGKIFPVKLEMDRGHSGSETSSPVLEPLAEIKSDLLSKAASLLTSPEMQTNSPSSAPKSDSSSPKKKGRPKRPAGSCSNASKKARKGKKKGMVHRQDSQEDSLQTMKLSRTFCFMQNKRKKGESVPTPNGPFSPFVRVEGKNHSPTRVTVINHPLTENTDPKAGSKKKVTGGAAVLTSVQISNLPSDKTVMLPSTKTVSETGWTCALCGKRSSYRFLGDLFGPYYLEAHFAVFNKSPAEASKKDGKQESAGELSLETRSARRRSRSSGPDVPEVVLTPQEVWVHEDCALWSNGVYLVGSRLYGLEEALKVATSTVCVSCRETGAMVGCLHKGCSQSFHYACAVDKDCFLDAENFSMLCPKHKDKRLKANAVSTSKS